MQEYKVARVHWTDACQMAGYHGADALTSLAGEPLPLMQSVGWLVYENAECVALAQTVSPYKAGDILQIPRAVIVELWIDGQTNGTDDAAHRDVCQQVP